MAEEPVSPQLSEADELLRLQRSLSAAEANNHEAAKQGLQLLETIRAQQRQLDDYEAEARDAERRAIQTEEHNRSEIQALHNSFEQVRAEKDNKEAQRR